MLWKPGYKQEDKDQSPGLPLTHGLQTPCAAPMVSWRVWSTEEAGYTQEGGGCGYQRGVELRCS